MLTGFACEAVDTLFFKSNCANARRNEACGG
jgi:hypothetical protein